MITPPPLFNSAELKQIAGQVLRDPCFCVPFLGAGVNVKDPARRYQGLLLGKDLANAILNEPFFESVLSPNDRENLAKVSLEYEMRNSRDDLIGVLKRHIPDDDHEPSPLLRTLARLPFQLIVTTNYDRLMERALALEGKKEGKDFLTIKQPTSGWDLRQDPSLVSRFQTWSAFPNLLLYKIHGSFAGRATRKRDPVHGAADRAGFQEAESNSPLIVTEEDYIEFMTTMGHDDPERVGIPQCIRSRMQQRMLLFLGYGLEDWDIRALYKGLIDSLENFQKRNSFAIQKNADPLWQDFWNQRRILVRNFDLYQFAEELHQTCFAKALNWSPSLSADSE